MKNEQLDLFSTNYAESGNTSQPSSAPGEEPFAKECNTAGCLVFLPAAGNRNGSSYNNVGTNGNYWSATLNTSNTNNAYNLNFNSGNCNVNNNNRNNGFSLRCAQESAKGSAPSFPVFQITKEQLLVDLFKAYYDARKHKRNTRNQLRFEMNLEENLVNLRDELYERTYKVGRSTCFIIEDPVKREIFAADFRDRVVHHLVYNYIMPIFERSCSKNYTTTVYALKMDIQGYFMNINRKRLFNGKSQLALLGEFIEHYSKFCLLQPEVKLAGS